MAVAALLLLLFFLDDLKSDSEQLQEDEKQDIAEIAVVNLQIKCLGGLEEKREYFHLNACLRDSGGWSLELLTKGSY